MSGDVQPRKRKDKKKKKDELGIEEPRGTSAVFGEGDVFMHSQHDHGTGGHWCAKIIFFFLLAVLVTLIGLIISENRGLTELEANSVESRYSGVFDGWLEDNADDHHDDHTLDLKHHDKKEIHKIKKYVEESSDQAYDDGDEKDLNYNRNNLYHETESDEIYGDNNDNGKDNLNEDDFANNLYTIGAQENDDDDNDDDSDELEDETEAFMYHKTVEQENDGDDIDDGDGVDNHVNNLHQNIDSDEINGDNSDNNNDSDEDDFENNFHETQKHEKDGDDIDDDSDEVDDENENFMYHKTVDKEIDGNDNDDEDDNDGIESHENNLYHKNEGREKYEDQIAEENNGEHYNDNSFYTKKTNGDEENEFSNEYQKSEPQHLEDEDHNDDNVEDNDSGVELERIEREVSDEEPISTELPALPEQEDDHDSEKETGNDIVHQEDVSVEEDNYEEFLESDEEFDTPIVDHITAPAGKPYVEVDEDALSEKPTPLVPDTLAEEEEYEKRQEELRREEEQASHEDGGNSVDEVWPGEPSDPYWRQQLDKAEEEFRQGAWSACGTRLSGHGLAESGRARWLAAQALDRAAEQRRDNTLLSQAISAYLHLLKMNERLSDNKLKEVAERTLDRIQFRGTYLRAESVYRLLIRRFPNDPTYRNKLSTSFLMANRADLAEEVIKETLQRWPKDRLALAHYGFILKTEHNRLEEAVEAFQKSLEGDTGPANEPRFYYHLGDSLLLLGRYTEAHEVHKRGAALGHFLSPAQRSLYNVPRLKSKPWWKLEDTPYVKLARALEGSWKEILKEGEVARELYEKEKEGLKERGDWSQLDLFVRGREIANRCKTTPVTCSIVRAEAAASECRRGQVKFSSMAAGTHVRPHVGPTNCRLRMHLGLSNTKDTYLRVDKETRQWTTGKVLLFDDSFEHEVWHNGTGARLVLIVDVWHPDLTPAERRQLPAI